MALSETQRVTLYQILEMPLFPVVNHLIDPDKLNYERWDSTASPRQAQAALELHLASLAATYPTTETELKTLLDGFAALGTSSVEMSGGGVGDIQGVSLSLDTERHTISERVKVIVPFYRKHEELEHQRNSNPQVRIIR
jgi:hypothetical protein